MLLYISSNIPTFVQYFHTCAKTKKVEDGVTSALKCSVGGCAVDRILYTTDVCFFFERIDSVGNWGGFIVSSVDNTAKS